MEEKISSEQSNAERLDSWKEISGYLRRGLRTAQRWEKTEALPVHRHVHSKLAAVYAFKSELDSWWSGRQPFSQVRKAADQWRVPQASIAVLPFVNIYAGSSGDYLADGLTEELTYRLSKVRGLRVASRTSSFQFKGKLEDIRRIAERLGVSTVLEGSVRETEHKFIITARLINAADGYHFWSEKYERQGGDIFALQCAVSQKIAEALKEKLVLQQRRRTSGSYTEGLQTHGLYLKGRRYWNRRTVEGLKRAIEYFELATESDPTCALAFAGLADSYALLGCGHYDLLPPKEAVPTAKLAALKALEIDDSLAEAWTSLAFIRSRYDWNWSSSESEFRRAIELNPNYVTAHHWYSLLLAALGRHDEAIARIKRALEIDPSSAVLNTDLGMLHHFARRHELAVEQCLKTIKLDPKYISAHFQLGLAYEQLGKYEEAIAEFQTAKNLSTCSTRTLSGLAHAYGVSGRKERAIEIMAKLKEQAKKKYVSSFDFALVFAGLGETDQALDCLEKAYLERSDRLGFLNAEPRFDAFRNDARFQSLIHRIGLPG